MKNRSNEQLCALAQKGNTNARDLLLENNFGFIRKTANEIYFGMNLDESELSIDKDDLEQEGCIGLLDAIPRFDSSKGAKFLTYAAPSIRNAMTNLIRDAFSQYEQRMVDTKDGLAFQKIRLDEVVPVRNGCCISKRLLTRLPNHRSRFMWNKKYCVNCMRDSIGLEGESKPICCTVMASQTI